MSTQLAQTLLMDTVSLPGDSASHQLIDLLTTAGISIATTFSCLDTFLYSADANLVARCSVGSTLNVTDSARFGFQIQGGQVNNFPIRTVNMPAGAGIWLFSNSGSSTVIGVNIFAAPY